MLVGFRFILSVLKVLQLKESFFTFGLSVAAEFIYDLVCCVFSLSTFHFSLRRFAGFTYVKTWTEICP